MKTTEDAQVCRPLSRRKTAQDLRVQRLNHLRSTRKVRVKNLGVEERVQDLTIQLKKINCSVSQRWLRNLVIHTSSQLKVMTGKEVEDYRKRGLQVAVIAPEF